MRKFSKILTITFALVLFTFISAAVAQAAPVLKQGMSGDSVVVLQKELQQRGFYYGAVDGIFGPNTRKALTNFQAARGLAVDGIAGPQTFSALNIGPAIASRGMTGNRQGIVASAKRLLGTRYAWGGTTPSGFDCSGFTYYVMRQHGISLPRTSFAQFGAGAATSQAQPGDLVFFTTYKSGASHVGIFIGNGQFIHCSSARGRVIISSLSDSYYKARYLGARSFAR